MAVHDDSIGEFLTKLMNSMTGTKRSKLTNLKESTKCVFDKFDEIDKTWEFDYVGKLHETAKLGEIDEIS